MSGAAGPRARAAKLPRQAGLTLIELLIGLALSAVIMLAFMSFYVEGQKYFFNQNTRADTLEDSRYPMAWISRDIREATQVHDGAVSVDGTDYSTSPLCLVLETPAIDGAGAIIAGVTDYIIYAVSGPRLLRIVEADAASSRASRSRVMADAVNAFGLVYLRSDGVTPLTSAFTDTFVVDVTLSSSRSGLYRPGEPYVETMNTQAKLRNKAGA